METTIAIVIVVLLFGGIINIWLWSNAQIVRRQRSYNASRITAGTLLENAADYSLQWPVYKPPELSEEKVLLDLESSEPETSNKE